MLDNVVSYVSLSRVVLLCTEGKAKRNGFWTKAYSFERHFGYSLDLEWSVFLGLTGGLFSGVSALNIEDT